MDHFPGSDGHHGAGHDHDHHTHHGLAEYYKEQLLTVLICGSFGLVAILMYRMDMLKYILAPDFRLPVLLGGIVLLVLTALRGVALWKEAGSRELSGFHHHDHAHHDHADHAHHDHAPGEVCQHDHAHHDHAHHDHAHHDHAHDHGHEDHDHGSIYWRVVILAFPIMLFCLELPNKPFSTQWIEKRLGSAAEIGDIGEVTAKAGEPLYDFNSLALASHSLERMKVLEGTPAKVKGQIRRIPNREKEFQLFYLKMTCCGADAVPLQARIVVTRPSILDGLRDVKDYDWVEVAGTIQFAQTGPGKYVTVVSVRDNGGIKKCDPVE